jgi:V/A-type H+-transporting ATPase subunit D
MDIPPTRTALLATKRQITIAERAHRVLKMKEEGLLLELIRIVPHAKTERDSVMVQYQAAEDQLAIASMMEGETGIAIAAFSIEEYPTFDSEMLNILGVHLPVLRPKMVKKTLHERGYGLIGTTGVIDEVADAYEDLVDCIIKSAEAEWRIKTLLIEIERTRRLVNSLEFKIIPHLYRRKNEIELRRDEIDREEHARLFLIKKRKAAFTGRL